MDSSLLQIVRHSLPPSEGKRVVVGLSGGVDSAVSAYLLRELGYEVIGVFMKNWEDDDQGCSAEEDAREARMVAGALGIPFYSFNFVKEYWDHVFQHFLERYAQGHTPNPDILCNKEIKFKAFLEKALALDVDLIATGHYARIRIAPGTESAPEYQLLKGIDPGKDQSYFLYALTQHALSKSLFPVGCLLKAQVRELARAAGLPNAERKDSTGICFIGERKFNDFLKNYLGSKPGPMVDPAGREVGRHDGLMYHTIGQRQGLGIGGPGDPWFVIGKDIPGNRLLVAQGKENPLLYASSLECDELTFLSGKPFELPRIGAAKIRYRQEEQGCRIEEVGPGRLRLVFDQPQRAITPKQAAVFYQGELCLGGGTIC